MMSPPGDGRDDALRGVVATGEVLGTAEFLGRVGTMRVSVGRGELEVERREDAWRS